MWCDHPRRKESIYCLIFKLNFQFSLLQLPSCVVFRLLSLAGKDIRNNTCQEFPNGRQNGVTRLGKGRINVTQRDGTLKDPDRRFPTLISLTHLLCCLFLLSNILASLKWNWRSHISVRWKVYIKNGNILFPTRLLCLSFVLPLWI